MIRRENFKPQQTSTDLDPPASSFKWIPSRPLDYYTSNDIVFYLHDAYTTRKSSPKSLLLAARLAEMHSKAKALRSSHPTYPQDPSISSAQIRHCPPLKSVRFEEFLVRFYAGWFQAFSQHSPMPILGATSANLMYLDVDIV